MDTLASARSDGGFTLIELLIVIVVLGILAGIVIFAIGSTREDAETAKATTNARICKSAIGASKSRYGDTTHYTEWVEAGVTCTP